MGKTRLGSTQCHYVSADGDEHVTTVDEVHMASVVAGQPVRPIRSFAGQKHYPGLFWSVTTGTHLKYESLLERDRFLLADFNPEVVGIAPQPFWLVGDDDGTTRRHVPDLLLRRRDSSFVVVDVKPADFVTHPKVSAVFGWTSRICASRGWGYEVWTGADAVVLANVRHIAAGRRGEFIADTAVADVRSAVRPGLTLGQLESATKQPRWAARRAVLRLLWQHELRADLTRPLGTHSIVETGAHLDCCD
ncbi:MULTISPECIES: TnsA-like heteromeric transposase endonuclease subunit [unclassified Mycolicibacterium]|uniref:TnsA-like heteromeric transposase endonuclease subunit n=1 Tax=unclassified Mycolicibacterium TaxID=2636767 RepID=UPI00130987EC|nr:MULTISPECIES: TnsA-like heteromeric transposase endonuclease subunit [unclassified Mycolicibacterium]MUL82008.1 TnsA-like heteromeric transposase endonuclease subunit [Mycolicibacterium sp. CBMA 329]MUL87774.1 TnsA-like heteromeric transposase endonuclease subunit [Mycolicibacterium sp. CBMA 331]MUM01598.1 TnsA-like heteromeric transposase endonuclease subunit [Mycolicibacterium sp. CBMA 334]MUM27279.1 TnsA-like heteromeric transposase endonuclease subunit [Mycolicibacterium sp. CBMA 295]MU